MREPTPLDGFPAESRALYLEVLLRRLQGHDVTFDDLDPRQREDLERIDARFAPLLREYLGAPLTELEAERMLAAVESIEPEASPDADGAAGESPEDDGPVFDATARYTVLGEIARGGMGVIYQVWDKDLRRELALKVIRGASPPDGGEDDPILRRFLREAQVTAQLDHPGVVPVHDVGIDAHGRVYFTMRLVQGRDLETVFALAREEREGWSRFQALEVFSRLCQTVAFAHSRGVVHRDLKPSNIMVGSFGEVYVMDWGLAKVQPLISDGAEGLEVDGARLLVDDDDEDQPTPAGGGLDLLEDDLVAPLVTGGAAVLGTPAYMSPEQARGDVGALGPASDVYAAGAILYTLLAGHAPFLDAPVTGDLVEMIMAGPPRALATIDGTLPVKLVHLCERAMAREPADRFARMEDLIGELQGYLEAEQHAAEEAERAREEARRARQVSGFLAGLFELADPAAAPADQLTARDLLLRGAERIGDELEDQLLLQGELLDTMGDLLRKLGLFDEALAILHRLVEGRREKGASRSELARSLHLLGQVHGARGDFEEAIPILEEARTLSEDSPAREAGVLRSIAEVRQALSDYDQAEQLQRRALELHRSSLPPDDPDLARNLGSLAWLLQNRGSFPEARALLDEALGIFERGVGVHLEAAATRSQLAAVHWAEGDYVVAEKLYREALGAQRDALGPDHPTVGSTLNDLAVLAHSRGTLVESEALFEEAIAITRSRLGNGHPELGAMIANQGMVLLERGDLERAADCLHEAIEIVEQLPVDDHTLLVVCRSNLARIHRARGELDDAESLNREALASFRRLLGEEHPFVARSECELAWTLRERGDLEGMEAHARRAREIRERVLGPEHPDVASSEQQLAVVERARGQFEASVARLRGALELQERRLPPGHPDIGDSHAHLGFTLLEWGHVSEGRAELEAARGILEAVRRPEDPMLSKVCASLEE